MLLAVLKSVRIGNQYVALVVCGLIRNIVVTAGGMLQPPQNRKTIIILRERSDLYSLLYRNEVLVLWNKLIITIRTIVF